MPLFAKYILSLGMLGLLVPPALSFDGEYNSDNNFQYQSSQPSYRSQYRDSRSSNQQYSYAPSQYGYGTRRDEYSAPLAYPSEPSYAAPTTSDGGDRPRKRKRHRRKLSEGAEDYSAPRRKRYRLGEYTGGQSGGGVPGSVVACVRTCDGSFFPVGQLYGQSLDAQEALCKSLCPSADTELYLIPPGADGITTAVSRDGHPYSKMRTALLYTKKRVAACSCHGATGQARLVSAFKDFTMRRGDAVMTASGIQVFLGSYRWPFIKTDFQILDKAKYVLANGLALAEVEKATKPLQNAAKRSGADDEVDDAADDNTPVFVTGLDGRKVRVIGDLQIFSAQRKPAADAPPPLRSTLAIVPQRAPLVEEPKKPADKVPTGSIVPLWRPGAR